jgi:hypothetical protein
MNRQLKNFGVFCHRMLRRSFLAGTIDRIGPAKTNRAFFMVGWDRV